MNRKARIHSKLKEKYKTYNDIKLLEKSISNIRGLIILGSIGMIFPWMFILIHLLNKKVEMFGSVQGTAYVTVACLVLVIAPVLIIGGMMLSPRLQRLSILESTYLSSIYGIRLYPKEKAEFQQLLKEVLKDSIITKHLRVAMNQFSNELEHNNK